MGLVIGQWRSAENDYPIDELTREIWVTKAIDSLRAEATYPGARNYEVTTYTSGNAMVVVSRSRIGDVDMYDVHDCLIRRDQMVSENLVPW